MQKNRKYWIKAALSFLLIVCTLFALAAFKYELILNQLENYLIDNEPPRPADVIIILSGNDMAQRVVFGVKLFKTGYAKKIIMSGGPYYWNTTCAKIMRKHALNLGVPESAILMEEKSMTTYENAKYLSPILVDQGFRSAIVVTSPYHTRRTDIIFSQLSHNKDIDLIICTFPPEISHPKSWWKDEVMTRFLVNEYFKLLWHYFFIR